MPIIDIKGVGKAEFPDGMSIDSIRDFLRNKYSQGAVSGQSDILAEMPVTATPYEPTLTEKFGQGIADVLSDTGVISNRYGAQEIGRNLSAIGEFLPVIGDATAGDEFGRAVAEGDGFGMALGALGVIPVAGDLAKNALKLKFPDLNISISEGAENIILNKVIVPDKSKGTGTKFMSELIKNADSKGKAVGLTPSSDFGGNKKRLTEFYKRFGFVPNKGKVKDFTISETMIRLPKKG